MDIQIGNTSSLYLAPLILVLALLVMSAVVARSRAAKSFATANLWERMRVDRTGNRRWIALILVFASLSLLMFAALDIRWGKVQREVPQKGIEVMFVLDVSRSMLAEDASPNRLTRAKEQIKDILDEMAGDRVGLLVFAGQTRQVVPLTSHYEDFKQALDGASPHSVRSGGSRLGEALAAATKGFITKRNDHKVIMVFTDGEDHESNPVEVAKRIHKDYGIRVFTVGLGDMEQGARIPESESGGFVQFGGRQVWSKMNGEILKQVATETEGAYIPAGTRRVNMADIYHKYVATEEQIEFETATIETYEARYQWFALPALVLLLAECIVRTWSSQSRSSRNVKNGGSMSLEQNSRAA